jgi:hypothetical protein
MKTKMFQFGLPVFAAAILAICATGCGTTSEHRNVKDLTPTSAMCDESSRSTLNVLGWHNETVKMDVASTNADGYFHSDNTTSHQSGFHPLRALLDRVSARFDATYDDRGYSSGWVGNVRLAQNYPQAVQCVNAPAMSCQQQQVVQGVSGECDVSGGQDNQYATPQGYAVLGYDQVGVAVYVSPRYPGWFWYRNQWSRQAPIARYNGGSGRSGYGTTYRQGPNTSGGWFNPRHIPQIGSNRGEGGGHGGGGGPDFRTPLLNT